MFYVFDYEADSFTYFSEQRGKDKFINFSEEPFIWIGVISFMILDVQQKIYEIHMNDAIPT